MIVGFIVVCGLGIAWDYYKPARFRGGYHKVGSTKNNGGGFSGSSSSSSDGGGDGGGCD